MAAKPGAETPTSTSREPARRMQRSAKATASACSSFGASPMMPSTVMPVAPISCHQSTMRSVEAKSTSPDGVKGVGAIG